MINKKLPITMIIQLLQSHKFYAVSDNVEIAKGKFQYNRDFSQIKNQFIRRIKKSWKS
jgi:hypothetical protein